jgi:hypothetical protein
MDYYLIGAGFVLTGLSIYCVQRSGITEPLILLYKMNQKKHKNALTSIYKTIHTILIMTYLILYQKLNRSLIHIKKNEYDVEYFYNGQFYKIKIKNANGPFKNQVLLITNTSSDDISEKIIPYLGPKYNFHNILYKPIDFDEQELQFYMSNGDILAFKNDEHIILK